jgi:hypothetical protein
MKVKRENKKKQTVKQGSQELRKSQKQKINQETKKQDQKWMLKVD